MTLPKKDFTAKSQKGPPPAKPELTPAQIKEQERFAKLSKLQKGAGIR